MKKWIAVTQRVERIASTGERRDALAQDWTALSEECGFLPLMLPNHLPTVQSMLEALPVGGIILTGGNDISSCGGDAPERDEVERYLIERSIWERIPLLGVCRGMQMLLDYFHTPLKRVEGHVRREHPLNHGDTVNSFHNWGAVKCGAPLIPEAWSTDGVLEAVGHKDYPLIHGIMWHPERYRPFREQDIERIRKALLL